jgi:hypothetical protein
MKWAVRITPALLCLAACGSPSEPDDSTPGIHIQVGAGVTDTVETVPAQALIVRITPPRAGLIVRFEQQGGPEQPQVLVSPLEGSAFGLILVDTTDATGKVATRVMLGFRAGTARLRITVPELGLVDSATYTILPGRPAGVHLLPRDTTVFLNGTVAIRGGARDRFGNPVSDPIVLTAQSPLLGLSGTVVTALHTGRGSVVGRIGSFVDSVFIGVVPDGSLSALVNGIRTFRTDGSQQVQRFEGFISATSADWSPDGQLLALDGGGGIQVFGLDGVFRTLTRGVGSELYPEFSADGQWLYYSELQGGQAWKIRRVRINGTGDELLTGAEGNEVAPAPSPDGTRVAFVVPGPDQLWLRTLATGATVLLALNGHTPAWSPTGDLIAYNASHSGQGIWAVSPSDGSVRRISPAGVGYHLGLDWSPDGRFLIARSLAGVIHLIEAASGTVFPLTFTGGWEAPAWRQ